MRQAVGPVAPSTAPVKKAVRLFFPLFRQSPPLPSRRVIFYTAKAGGLRVFFNCGILMENKP